MRKTLLLGLVISLFALGCQRNDMWTQPRQNTYSATSFFADGRAARMPVDGTVPRGHLNEDDLLYRGTARGQMTAVFPMAVTKEVLESGMERYNIFCSPCHGKSGDGLGMIVQRGFKQPASFHEDRLRNASPGYYYAVMTRGYNALAKEGLVPATNLKEDFVHPPVSHKMSVEERWATIAFIRALQRSQMPKPGDVSPEELEKIKNPPKEEPEHGEH